MQHNKYVYASIIMITADKGLLYVNLKFSIQLTQLYTLCLLCISEDFPQDLCIVFWVNYRNVEKLYFDKESEK